MDETPHLLTSIVRYTTPVYAVYQSGCKFGESNLSSTLATTMPEPQVDLNRQNLTSTNTSDIEQSASAAATTEGSFYYIEDPNLSEALYDIDQGLYTPS